MSAPRPPGRTVWIGLALLACYPLLGAALGTRPLTEALQAVRIAIGVAVAVAYGTACLDALLGPRLDRVHQLALGIALAWTAAVLAGSWSLLWRLAGEPAWMLGSALEGFLVWLQILGGSLHLTAPGAIDGRVPKRNWIMLGLAAGGGAGLGALLVATRPDLRALVDALEPYLRP